MPTIVEKQEVLNGRGQVIRYGSGTSAGSYFYKEKIPGERRYKTRRIQGATTIEEAVQAAVEIAFKLQEEQPPESISDLIKSPSGNPGETKQYVAHQTVRRAPKRQRIENAIDGFLREEQRRVDVGLLSSRTLTQKRLALKLHLLPYLEQYKNVLYTNQIELSTFRDYEIFRAKATPLTRNGEITIVKDFSKNYLVRHRLLAAELLMDRDFLKRGQVKQTDKLANPAICAEDWETIVKYARGHWRDSAKKLQNHRIHYWRTLFWHWILFAKNTGMSPEKINKLKWKQIEIVDEGRFSASEGKRVTWEVAYIYTIRSKTQQAREIPANIARELKRWKKLQQQYMKEQGIDLKVTPETVVFSNPHNDLKGYSYSSYTRGWADIRKAVKAKMHGHRFSPHPYTIYSMRSTFIEDHLLKGTPVFEVAEMAGHSVMETQKTYARLNLRKKGREITMPRLGKRKDSNNIVDLFNEE